MSDETGASEAPRAARLLPATVLLALLAAAACDSGREPAGRADENQNRSPHGAAARRAAMQTLAEERIRSSMPNGYRCDGFTLERAQPVDPTAGDRAGEARQRWCLHLEYACRTAAAGKRKKFGSVVEVTYLDADGVVADLAMGPLFIWADPGFVGVNWTHCAAGTGVAPPS